MESPAILWQGIFGQVADALGERSWPIWAGTYSALSSLAHRNLHWYYHGDLYAHSYVLVVAGTGTGKSKATRLCRALLPPSYRVVENIQSAQSLMPAMGDCEDSKNYQGEPTLLLYEEWSTLLDCLGYANSSLQGALCDLFQRPYPWELIRSSATAKAGGRSRLEIPILSILGTTTRGLLLKGLTNKHGMSGFLNRYLILPGSDKPWTADIDTRGTPLSVVSGIIPSALTTHTWGLGQSLTHAYTAGLSEEQERWIQEHFAQLMNAEEPEADFYKRLHVYSHLIALIYAWQEKSVHVCTRHVEAARAVVTSSFAFLTELFVDNPLVEKPAHAAWESEQGRLLEHLIQRQPGLSFIQLFQRLRRHVLKKSTLHGMLSDRVHSGLVSVRDERYFWVNQEADEG